MKAVIGIDPGRTGAAVILPEHGKPELFNFKGVNTHDWFWEVHDRLIDFDDVTGILERVGSKLGNRMQSVFTFGKNTGKAEMLLEVCNTQWCTVEPQVWEAYYHLIGGTKEDAAKRARKLYPWLSIDKHNADAVLIADYGWRQRFSELNHDYTGKLIVPKRYERKNKMEL